MPGPEKGGRKERGKGGQGEKGGAKKRGG